MGATTERVTRRVSRTDVRTAVLTISAGLLLNFLGLQYMFGDPLVTPPGPTSLWFTLMLLVGGGIMLVKRLNPAVALAGGAVLLAADGLIGGSLAVTLVIFDLLYTVGRYSSLRVRTVVLGAIAVVALAFAIIAGEATRDVRAFVLTGLQVGAVGLVPIWWAAEVRRGDDLARAAAEQARLESERADAVARAAASERDAALRTERDAMAGDLHDLVSSHLSAIAILSGAVLAGAPDVDRQREALRQVRTEALASLEEMRSMVQLLRSTEDRSAWTTSAGLDQLPALLQRFRDAGLTVTVDAHDLDARDDLDVPDELGARDNLDARDDLAELPVAVGRAAYRVAHESLTNALRHGDGTAHVYIRADDENLHLSVTNPTRTGPGDLAAAPPSSATGLLTMRERTEASGGTFDAGGADGHWRVRATFPLTTPTRLELR